MTQANDERAARKQYIRRRQKVVFTITGTILTIALVISLLFFFHVGGLAGPACRPRHHLSWRLARCEGCLRGDSSSGWKDHSACVVARAVCGRIFPVGGRIGTSG